MVFPCIMLIMTQGVSLVIKTEKLTKYFGRFISVEGLDLEVAPG